MRYSPFRHLPSAVMKRRPIHLTFFLTRRCNARCRFCFYLSEQSLRQRDGDQLPELSLPEIETVSSSLGSLLWLALSGGEPFLRQDLSRIVRIFYERNRPSIILIPTNGLLPDVIRERTQEILDCCKRSTVVVKLSLDGLGAAHDRLRGVPGGFRKVLETREKLVPLLDRYPNFELGINTVFCAENQHLLPGLIAFVRGLKGVRTHTVSLVRGPAGDGSFNEIDAEWYERTIRGMERDLRRGQADRYRFSGAGIKAAQDILQRRLIHETVRQQRRLVPCSAGALSLVLTESGAVYPCESFDRKMGNIRDYECDLTKLLASGQGKQAVDSIRRGSCWCTHECSMMMNILFNPACYPALAKEYLRLARPGSVRSGSGLSGSACESARTES